MRRSSWYAFLFVAIVRLGIAGLFARVLVSRIGWLGILILGLFILIIAVRAELDADLGPDAPARVA